MKYPLKVLITVFFSIIFVSLNSCRYPTGDNGTGNNSDSLKNKTVVTVHYDSTVVYGIKPFSIKFVELVSDNRCPEGVDCIQAGKAVVIFDFMENYNSASKPVKVTLSTDNNPQYQDVGKYRISLIDVLPHPSINKRAFRPEEYSALVQLQEIK